jgi:5-methylcytosine-specific restriction endonuclease McrA
MDDELLDLPAPDSPELNDAVSNRVGRRIYGELHEAGEEGLNIGQLKERIPEFADQMHFDRRLRDLDKPFDLARKRRNGAVVYRLAGRRPKALEAGRVSKTLRAEIFFRDGSRCQMCGASPERDPDVLLHVDHRIPLRWGGSNTEANLWTLCSECNTGKQAFFASVDEHSDRIRAAINEPEVHRRIGELLRAFGPGTDVPSYLLGIVASAQQFQEDWQRRIRELRDLGWDYEVTKRKEGGRVVAYYRLTKDGGWPPPGTTVREALNRRRR